MDIPVRYLKKWQESDEGLDLRPPFQTLLDRKNLIGCEIGVLLGENAYRILSNLDIEKLYLIDNWSHTRSNKQAAMKKLRQWNDKLIWLDGNSLEQYKHIPDKSLDFVYHDGNHEFPHVVKEIELYLPKVKIGGMIGGNDYNHGDVSAAVHYIFGSVWIDVWRISSKKTMKDWWINIK